MLDIILVTEQCDGKCSSPLCSLPIFNIIPEGSALILESRSPPFGGAQHNQSKDDLIPSICSVMYVCGSGSTQFDECESGSRSIKSPN